MDYKITAMYSENKRSYMGQYGGDVIKTLVPVVIILFSTIQASYYSVVKQARSNWENEKCNPIYMPFAGTINPQIGKSGVQTTLENFTYCVHTNLSAAFGIILMPLEYTNFMILASIDLIIQSMIAIVKLYNKLLEWLKKFGFDINNMLGNLIIPIIITVVKIRDAMARASMMMLTSLYTTLTIYNLMVAGLLSIANIVMDLLILLSALIAAMMAAGAILTALVITAPIGAVIIGLATVLLTVLFIPTLVIYILLSTFMVDVFGAKARPVCGLF